MDRLVSFKSQINRKKTEKIGMRKREREREREREHGDVGGWGRRGHARSERRR